MNDVGQIERKTQNRVVKLFQSLGYDYLGNLKDESNTNIREDDLRGFLNGKYSEGLIKKAVEYFKKETGLNSGENFYERNKKVYDQLRYGVKVRENIGDNHTTVWLVDWNNPANNHFAIAEEVTVVGRQEKRPDIVLYLNGIAVGVLELKRSVVSVSEGVRQNIGNQKPEYIQEFFTTMQLLLAGNDTEGLRYATTETPEKYWMEWKEEDNADNVALNKLDRQISAFCEKSRLLDIIHNFIIFDAGTKKTCRHNQYFGVKSAQRKITHENKGGVIWHTQGSGKSLTMVWLAKWLLENSPDARVLLLTDRTELDEQIERVFNGVNENIWRADNSRNLFAELNRTERRLLCSLVHKFGRVSNVTGEVQYDIDVEELRKNLPGNFSVKGKLFVFVDECHRTHSGKLHEAMKELLGEGAVFIGFTGTPLLKVDKTNSQLVWGDYIHTYKYNEAVKDGVVLDLRYEARDVPQLILEQDGIDRWFDAKTANLTDIAKAELKKKWGTMQNVMSSATRMQKIVSDIEADFETRPRLKTGRGNAMLVASSIAEAFSYYKLFQDNGNIKKCAVVTSYSLDPNDTDSKTYEICKQMLSGRNTEDFENEAKRLFVNEPGQMQLLIVVDKLLTGFDAPSATYLYIDKNMRDHGLFQAICRVNRLDDKDADETMDTARLNKEYGYIVDYRDLFMKLEKSVSDYTAGALDSFDAEDVLGLLKDKNELGAEDLQDALEVVRTLCEPVQPPKTSAEYIRYFCGETENVNCLKETEQLRLKLYKAVASLVRRYEELKGSLQEVGYNKTQAEALQKEVEHFQQIKQEIKLASGDYINLKDYNRDMRSLLDQYILARDSEVLTNFDNKGLVDLLIEKGAEIGCELKKEFNGSEESVAESVENNVRRLIIDEMQTNPKYYQKMSELLTDLIRQRKENSIAYNEYLQKIVELAKQVKDPNTNDIEGIDTRGKKAIYDFLIDLNVDRCAVQKIPKNKGMEVVSNLCEIVDTTQVVYNTINDVKQADFRDNVMKERRIKKAIHLKLPNLTDEDINNLFEIIKSNEEF